MLSVIKRTFFIVALLSALPSLALAEEASDFTAQNSASAVAIKTDAIDNLEEKPSLWQRFKNNTAETWNNPDYYDIYVPFFTWHARFAYDQEKIDSYNEKPWGAGFGMTRYDEDGDWHGLYVIAFKDSHNNWEPGIGYAYEKIWRPFASIPDFRIGGGLNMGLTARKEWHYIPVPAPLPMASISYKRFAIQAMWIPGTYNNGNVLFAWARIMI